MPDTRTERMMKIADDFEDDGNYTRANSVRAVTAERDELFAVIKRFVNQSWLAGIAPEKDSDDPLAALLFDAHAAIRKRKL